MATTSEKTRLIQSHVGVAADGVWGSDSADAVIAALGISVPQEYKPMTDVDLQKIIGANPDGQFGPASRKALSDHFSNRNAPAVTSADIAALAARLGCTVKQITAVSLVESSGSAFDASGRPKILFERHKFHKHTGGKWSVTSYSNPKSGGYAESSWDKLGLACAKDVDAAFMSCSWGKFQVLGEYWDEFGFSSPYAFAYACVGGEAAHYDLFARYIEMAKLHAALRKISTNPEDCKPFTLGYNGQGGVDAGYHIKIAAAMR